LSAATAEEIPEASTIGVEDLVAALKDGQAIKVLDVRTDTEFASGHIAGAIHQTSEALLDDASGEVTTKDLIERLAKESVEKLVVHCMYSTNRGPAVVNSLTAATAELGVKLEVALLVGGFHKFMNTVWEGEGTGGDVPGLLEGMKSNHWRRTKSHGLVAADAVDGLAELGVVETD